jgi:uncharacterized protein
MRLAVPMDLAALEATLNESRQSTKPSRRYFGGLLAGAGAAIPGALAQTAPAPAAPQAAPPAPPARRGPRQEVAPFGETIEFTRADLKPKAEAFPMTQVRVTGGPLKDAQEWNRGYMARLNGDRLLYNFRKNAGLDVKGAAPLGGWEGGTELRGHFTGHFLSASALLWASTGDKEAKAKADYMVDELAKAQQRLGGAYLSAFPTELFERLDKISVDPETGRARPGGPRMPWAPFYTVHKIIAGMLDMHRLAGSKQALDVAVRMAEWADGYSGSKSEAHMQEILAEEFGGMAESLYDVAVAANDSRWARVGDRFTKKRFVNPLALRRDELRGLHVNTHVPQAIAAARRYEISGDTRFHDVADFFWDEVTGARSYVTTGTSNNESWQTEPRRLAAELREGRTTATAECCCSYNMLKLTRHLYSWKASPRYFDYYERALFNHRYGTILPEKGYTQYFHSLMPGAWKTFNDEDHSFWCCTGTGVEEFSKIGDSIYWRDGNGLFVNLFVPSELNWEERGFRLRQETKFPDEESTALVVTAARPAAMAVRLRVPAWLASAPVVKLNGRALEASAAPGSYLTITRTWKAGDRIEMALPMRLTVEALPDDPATQAFLYGPLVLAGDLGSEGLDESRIIGLQGPRMALLGSGPGAPRTDAAPPLPALEIPAFKAAKGDPASWIKPSGAPHTFRSTGQQKDVTMRPLNSIFGKRYAVYWQVG